MRSRKGEKQEVDSEGEVRASADTLRQNVWRECFPLLTTYLVHTAVSHSTPPPSTVSHTHAYVTPSAAMGGRGGGRRVDQARPTCLEQEQLFFFLTH